MLIVKLATAVSSPKQFSIQFLFPQLCYWSSSSNRLYLIILTNGEMSPHNDSFRYVSFQLLHFFELQVSLHVQYHVLLMVILKIMWTIEVM
jgi:hypothetical protein